MILENCRMWFENNFVETNIEIEYGIIKKIELDAKFKNKTRINLNGELILPGLVDAHVHFREPGLTHKEDWLTGSRAAIKGGITYVIDMPNTIPPTSTVERILFKKELAEKSLVNFGLNSVVSDNNIDQIQELASYVTAFKIFMGQSTGNLKLNDKLFLKAFSEVSKTEKVLCVHAEDQEINDKFHAKYKDSDDPIAYAYSRPPESEIKAIDDAIEFAEYTGVRLHVCHVTTKKSLRLINRAKKHNVDVTCETCPHYLFMTQEDLKDKKAFAKMNPPLRTKQDQKALWKGLRDGTIDMIVSDHAPHTLEEKSKNIWSAPAGVPGVETTLPLMLNAVNEGKITLDRLIKLMHDNPVKRFDLYDHGNIKVGNRANITIINLDKKWVISRENLKTKCGWSSYEGLEGMGDIMGVIVGDLFRY